VWNTGALPTEPRRTAEQRLQAIFSPGYSVAGLYSTGMEAFEFATRVARGATRRNRLIGFARNMHGKSTVAATLGWDNHDGLELPHCTRLPYPPDVDESQALSVLADELAKEPAAAICVEPLQGSGGGTMLSSDACQQLAALARSRGALVIFDEILTGVYRTGPRFFFNSAGIEPDIVLVGKSLGNGFPISAVVAREGIKVTSGMLPGSTFAGNPLAAAAAVATLNELEKLDLPRLVEEIARTIQGAFASICSNDVQLRGRGALWIVQLPDVAATQMILGEAYSRGVAIGATGRYLRLLPPATIEPEQLAWACRELSEAISQHV
jgi:acetylornithine/succinyldiaminopimelate/putrescine aminotransferase